MAPAEPDLAGSFRVLLLGSFTLERDGVRIDTRLWQHRVASLFKLLVAAPGYRRQRDELIEELWPEADPETAGGNLRTVAHRLRAALGGGRPFPIVAEHGWVSLNPAYRWEVDLHTFQQKAALAGDDASRLQEALALYRGEPLLEERYEDWAIVLHDRLQGTWRDLSLRLAAVHAAQGAMDDALRVYERMLEADPIDEEALRALLTALYHAGRPADALRRYHQFEQRLAQELGVPPSPETMAVVQELHAEVAPRRAEGRSSGRSLPVGGFLGAVPEGPLVAREEPLGQILLVADVVAGGSGHVVLVAGERGVGKTRLAQEVMLHLQARGFVVSTARCAERAGEVPLYPFYEAIEQTYRAYPAVQHRVARLGARLPASVVAGEEGGDVPPPRDPEPMAAAEERYLLNREITDFFLTVAENKPLAILVDDLQWADHASLDLLQYLAAHTRDQPVLLLATHRDEAAAPDHPVGRAIRELAREGLVERIHLNRLGEEGTATLVRASVGDMAALDEFAEFVHRRTRGIPFYIHEMLESLGGRYTLIRHIGSGGMGRVFEAIDAGTGNPVAVKIMFTRTEADPRAVRRFEQEGATLARLKHPNIVTVYDTYISERLSYIAMELLDGQSLAAALEGERFSPQRIKRVMQQVASALASAHGRGVVHRDVKPANIMLMPDDEVKLTDFGIARLIRPDDVRITATTTGMTLGTPLYMAPEQIEGRPLDGRADVYAAGAILYEMVTGRPPFEGHDAISIAFRHVHEAPEPPHEVRSDVPDEWSALILKALAKDPTERFSSAAGLEQAISRLRESPWTEPNREIDVTEASESAVEPETAPEQPVQLPEPERARTRFLPRRSPARLLVGGSGLLGVAGAAVLILSLLLPRSGTTYVAYGSPGSGSQQLNQPSGVAIDGHGHVFIADSGNNRISELGPSGRLSVYFGAPPGSPVLLSRPHHVAVDTKGDVFVADLENDQVKEFMPGGRIKVFGSSGSDVGQFAAPTGLTIDSRGNVVVADSKNFRIEEFSPTTGKFGVLPPLPFTSAGSPSRPSDVAVDLRGNTFVADYDNNRILKLAAGGLTWRPWGGGSGHAPGKLFKPAGVATDRNGDVYVADQGNNRIQEFSPAGLPMHQWGSAGSGPGQLNSPSDVSLDGRGHMFVADSVNNRIQEFAPDGTVLHVWTPQGPGGSELSDPQSVVVDLHGTLFVADTGNDVIRRYLPNGTELRPLGIADSSRLNQPRGVAVAHGLVYVADSAHARVEIIKSPNEDAFAWGTEGPAAGQFQDPEAVAVDALGHVYVADAGNNWGHEYSALGKPLGVPWLALHPRGIALEANGNLVLSDTGHNRVILLSPSTKGYTSLQSWGRDLGLREPTGVAVDRSGNIYVADTGHDRIVKLSKDGTLLATWGSSGKGRGQFRQPTSIAVDSQGHIFVADTGNGRVVEIEPKG